MALIDSLLQELNEENLIRKVGLPHDEARNSYRITKNTVADYREFEQEIAQYYNHHHQQVYGVSFPDYVAREKAKAILNRQYGRSHGDEKTAYNDAHLGTNGGLSAVLSAIADSIKHEARTQYGQDLFNRYINPMEYQEKVEIIRQFFQRVGHLLPPGFELSNPARYCNDYMGIVDSYVQSMNQVASQMRRH